MTLNDHVRKTLESLDGQKVLIVGDIMLDRYMIGSVERISPEAPVPVVHVEQERHVLGGAGNVALNIAALGGQPHLIGMVGTDREADKLDTILKEAQLSASLIRDPHRPTTVKTRILASNQQICRVDHEVCDPPSRKDTETVFKHLQEELKTTRVVILSDYGKGFICGTFMDRFMNLVRSMRDQPHILVDPKIVNYDLYKGVTLLTPNAKEAGEGAGILVKNKEDVLRAGDALFNRLDCSQLLITLGADGMALFEDRNTIRHIPSFAKKVFDVTGAGDTVIAALGLALAAGAELLVAGALANYAAGITVGQVGAATATVDAVLNYMDDHPVPDVSDWS